jgi:hypothetical protein
MGDAARDGGAAPSAPRPPVKRYRRAELDAEEAAVAAMLEKEEDR